MKILFGLIATVVVLIVLGFAIPVLWPMVATTATANITAMTGTDEGTVMIKAFWPIILMLVGLGISVGLIVYALKRFGLMSGKID